MKAVEVISRDLLFGPFKTEWFRESVDEAVRRAAVRYIEEQVAPRIRGDIFRLGGAITSHYDAPEFAGRRELGGRYFLQLEFHTEEGVTGASGEIMYDPATASFSESPIKPVQVQLLRPAPAPPPPVTIATRQTHHRQFQVDDVRPCCERLPGVSLGSALERNTKTKMLRCLDSARQVIANVDFHPLVAAAAFSYQRHYPLVLSPDMIWLTILQGVSQHIQNHSEQLRPRLVQHQTKIELIAGGGTDLPQDKGEMLEIVRAFSGQIRRHLQPGKRALFEARFSTSTEVEELVAGVVIMEAFQPYFDYVFTIICGIPSVILEGTIADWKLLEQKVQALDESDLELSWWTGQLLPLCREFTRAAAGDVDRDHWRNLCKIVHLYGVDDMNGWLLKFIPYVRYGRNTWPIHRNPVLDPSARQGRRMLGGEITGCTSDMLPTGVSSVPVILQNAVSGESKPIHFVAGLTGVEQSPDDLGLRPVIGWAIAEAPLIDEIIHRLRQEYGCTAPKLTGFVEDLVYRFKGNLPGDVWKYYTEIESVDFHFREPNQWGETGCSILPTDKLKQWIALRETASEDPQFRFPSMLLRIAEAHGGGRAACYLFDPDRGVYHWTGVRRAEAFTKVATRFSEWLMDLLRASSKGNPSRMAPE